MKIAICLSGHLRKFTQTYPTFQSHVLQNHECDVFISTWDRMGYVCTYRQDPSIDITEKYMVEVQRLYKPKKIIVESSSFVEDLKQQGNEYAPHLKNEPKHVGHMASMFYKIYAANELRKRHELETGINYDWVIRCRPDLIFQSSVSLPTEKIAGRIYLPKSQFSPGWYSDQFAIGLPHDMDLYSAFFFNMPEYFTARNEFYPEKFMNWSLQKAKLTPMPWDLNFYILR